MFHLREDGGEAVLFAPVMGSRLPSATILYLHRFGLPSPSYLIMEIAIVGRHLALMTVLSCLYLSSVTAFHVPSFCRPSYSSLYASSHRALSMAGSLLCFRSDSAFSVVRPCADTCLQHALDIPCNSHAVDASRRFFQPLKSFLFSRRECISCLKCGNGMDGFVFFHPRTNSHSPGTVFEWMM